MNEEERFLIIYRRCGDRRPVAAINDELMIKLNQVTVEPVTEARYTGRYHRPVGHHRPRAVELATSLAEPEDPGDQPEDPGEQEDMAGPHDVCPWCQRIWAKHPGVPNEFCVFPKPLPGDMAGTVKTAHLMAEMVQTHGVAYAEMATERMREASA
jgi:hypothetical protein